MKHTKYLYRIDGRNPTGILNRKPLTVEEVKKLPKKEQLYWTRIAGVEDKDMKAYQIHFI
jgi:hypothetical protein